MSDSGNSLGLMKGSRGARLTWSPLAAPRSTKILRRDASKCLSGMARRRPSWGLTTVGPRRPSRSDRAPTSIWRTGAVDRLSGMAQRRSPSGLTTGGPGVVNGNRKPHICGNRKLHTSGEDVSGGADILPVMPVGRVGLDAGSGATGVLANTRRDAAEPAVTWRLPHAVRPTLSSASADAPASGNCCPGC